MIRAGLILIKIINRLYWQLTKLEREVKQTNVALVRTRQKCDRQALELNLAYQRIDELELRCSRLHRQLLDRFKRRPAHSRIVIEGDYDRYPLFYRN